MRCGSAAALLAALVVLSSCGGGSGSGKPVSDRAAIDKLYTKLTSAGGTNDWPAWCSLSTKRFQDAAAFTAGVGTCPDGVSKLNKQLPITNLKRLAITGSHATASAQDSSFIDMKVKFAKQGGDWKLDGLTGFANGTPVPASTNTQTTTTPSVDPGKLHTAAGREIAGVVSDFYTGLENEDTGVLCRTITPSAKEKVIAIGSIQDAKTCGSAYKKIFNQLSFSYTQTPHVVRVTISGSKARATTMFGSHTTKAPLKKISGAWKVDTIG